MKKTLILAAVAAIAAVGCTKTYHQVDPATQGPAIGFGTWTETLTKAPRTNTFTDGETFAVYGTKTNPSVTQEVVFKNQLVSYTESTTAWSYTPIRFWDPTATNYTFFAVMPSSVSLAAETTVDDYPKSGIFKSDDITFSAPTTANQDILIASKKEITSINYAPVQLDFNHIASLVDVKVKKDAALPASATLKITAAQLRAINQKGTFEVKSYATSSPFKPVIGTTVWGWEPDATPTTTTYSSPETLPLTVANKTAYDGTSHDQTGTTDGSDGSVTVPGGLQSLFTQHVLMPQNLAGGTQKLYIAYDIITQESPEVKTSYTKEIALKDFVTTDNTGNPTPAFGQAWVPGTHYTYVVTIGANAITFTANINDWTPETGYRYLIQ